MATRVGNIRVYCNGKIFVGPDWKSLFVSFLLILLPSLLYLALIAVEMGKDIFWFGFLLVVFNLTMLGLTGLSNPGIIPRRPAQAGSNAHPIPSTRTKDYKINGYTISTKYCTTCQIYRVPRCSHCAMSDNCVEKFDHYCPWVGTCIGRRNYRFFLMFVFSGTALCLLVCATSLSRLVEISGDNDDEFDTALKREPIAIVLVIYTFGAIWFVGGLSAFHTYLVLTNQTTYEHIRRRFGQHGNPYNKGILMNLFEACCQPNPPYDWENGGSQVQSTQESSRNMELPVGVVLNPTVIAMRQAAKEEAEQAQRAGSNRGSDVGSCSYNATILQDNQTSMNEYQESLTSSVSSVDGRQLGMTGQLRPELLSFAPPGRSAHQQSRSEPEIAQEDAVAERDEGSSASLEQRESSKRSLTDSVSRRPSVSSMTVPGSKTPLRTSPSTDKRQWRRHPTIRGDSANTSISRYSESEMAMLKAAKRTGNPFELQREDPDIGRGDIAPTQSSLTSNTTSEVSSHRTDRSDYHSRKQAQMQKNRKRVLSMQEIMSSHTSIPALNVARKHSAQQESRRSTSADAMAKMRLFGSDSLARLRTLRSSGENMFNHLRAKMKRHSGGSQDLQEQKPDTDLTEPVFIDIDEPAEESERKQPQRATEPQQPTQDRVQDEGHGLLAWVPQLPPLTQQKYTELKEIPSFPFDEAPNEDVSSRDVLSTESAPSANNPTLEDPAGAKTAVEPHQSRLSKHGGDEDVETLL